MDLVHKVNDNDGEYDNEDDGDNTISSSYDSEYDNGEVTAIAVLPASSCTIFFEFETLSLP